MANPAKKLESLLRLHRFELVSQNKHLKYKNPQGRLYIMSKTPSDIRAGHRMLATFKRVIADPPPTSEVIEEMRQRKELEAAIELVAQHKPSGAGIAGAGKGKKSKGVGIYYDEKLPPTAEELALREELRQRAQANAQRKEEDKKQRRDQRRASEEWSRQLWKFRRATRQVIKDNSDIFKFMFGVAMLAAARKMAADGGRDNSIPRNATVEQRERLVNALFAICHRTYYEEQNATFCRAVETSADHMRLLCAQLLMRWGGRVPRFLEDFPEEPVNLGARQVRLMQAAVAFFDGETVEVPRGELRKESPPRWLCEAVMRLRAGENKYEPAQ